MVVLAVLGGIHSWLIVSASLNFATVEGFRSDFELNKRLQESRFRPRPAKLDSWALRQARRASHLTLGFFRIVQSQFLTGLSLQASKTLIVTKMNFDYILSVDWSPH